jgi:hypothetical protein
MRGGDPADGYPRCFMARFRRDGCLSTRRTHSFRSLSDKLLRGSRLIACRDSWSRCDCRVGLARRQRLAVDAVAADHSFAALVDWRRRDAGWRSGVRRPGTRRPTELDLLAVDVVGGSPHCGKHCGGQHNRQRQAGQWTPSRREPGIMHRDDLLCRGEQGSHATVKRARFTGNDFDRVIAGSSCRLVAWPAQRNVVAFRQRLKQRRAPALEAPVA